MHRTLKHATTKPPKMTLLEQQKCFDAFIQEYNKERPHQGINNKTPAKLYKKSKREYETKLQELKYPDEFQLRRVRSNGEVKWEGKKIYVSALLPKELLGFEMIDECRAFVYFGSL